MGLITYGTTQDDATGLEGALAVGTSAVEIKVGSTAKDGRNMITLFNNSTSIIYWGYTSSVTTSTGTPIYIKQFISWSNLDPATTLFVIAGTNGNDTRITELT